MHAAHQRAAVARFSRGACCNRTTCRYAELAHLGAEFPEGSRCERERLVADALLRERVLTEPHGNALAEEHFDVEWRKRASDTEAESV